MPANAAANRYELKELLGEGGMGVVYRALDTRTNSYVALKTLRDATDPAMLEMFKREWAELGKVPHPNIVDIRDVDEIEENGVRKPCFIMPLLPGCTLAALIKSSSPRLTTEFVVNVICQVCKGLQAAHEKDLIHRDLKPSNIFIMEDDTAKIIDFGLVHTVGNKSTTGLKGTWQYMSPEQIEGTKQPNRSFDIFSLGVVAYEALTGHQPFKRARFEDTVEAVRHFVPQPISERNPKVPQLLSKAVQVAIAKQPIHRYATAREFAESLQKAYQNQYIERFDPVKIRPRIDRAKKAFNSGDSDFASEILTELEAEGNIDTDITLLRSQIDEYSKHKRVRQLFEAAQTRLEQDEIPLALEKLEEIIKIDPQNPDALKLRKRIEEQRSQQQVSDWLALARKHLDRHDFDEAGRALKEVFNLKYDDPDAARLKSQVDSRKKEVEAALAEKQHLYSHALRQNQNGEISSALSKLEKLLELSRNVPGASVPERDKVFQAFYNDVRTERDRIDNAYADGSRHLTEKNFDKALLVCDGILTRYPQNPQFQALRLKVEQSQRQDLSAYIAEVGRAVDTEPNLDRRVGLLEEACKRRPSEVQFSRQLSLARELRDLVASIVTRARNYEEQGQFSEAIAQWNTLANIHPHYPGIDFEISQLERRREQQAEEDKKSRLVEKIDRALGNAAYADAERLSQDGLLEFPQNPELLALLRLSRQGLDQTHEADRLFEDAKTQRAAGDWDKAVALLRQALELDRRNIVVSNTLVNLLVERSHALLDTDPTAAEPLAAEAERLDPEHPSVKKVISLIAQAKRKHYVEQTVLQARALQNTDRHQAIDVLKQGLSVYPGEGRLQQTLSNLQKEDRANGLGIGASNFGANTPDDKTAVYLLEQTERSPLPAPAAVKPAAPLPFKSAGPAPIKPAATGPTLPPWWQTLSRQIREAGTTFSQNLQTRLNGQARNVIGVVLGLLASLIVIGVAYWFLNRTPKNGIADSPITVKISAPKIQVAIQKTPTDATVILDSNLLEGNTTPPLEKGSRHHIAVSRLGYQTIETSAIQVTGKPWEFPLIPEPLKLIVSVSQPNGTVWLDDQRVGELDEGSWSATYPVKTSEEQHVLLAKAKSGEQLFKISYTTLAGKPAVVAPLRTKDLIVSSTLGKDALLYAGNSGSRLALAGQARKSIPTDGLAFNIGDASGSIPILNGKHPETLSMAGGQAPVLSISLNAAPNFSQISISVIPKNAKLFVDGDPMTHPKKPGFWSWQVVPGSYKAKLTADGMNEEDFQVLVKKGLAFSRKVEMRPLGPPPATLLINNGPPGATVSIDDSPIGELDEKGNIVYRLVSPGVHRIQLSKSGFSSRTFSGNKFDGGKTLELRGDKSITALTGYAKVLVKPANAAVFYRKPGESEKHPVSDFSKAITLLPGSYEFTADAPKHVPIVIPIQIEPEKTSAVNIELQPITDDIKPVDFFSADEVAKRTPDWYHGKTNGYIRLLTSFHKNTILFSKDLHVRKMMWMVFLDDDNTITYTFDGKKITISHRIDGARISPETQQIDLSGTAANTTESFVIAMNLEKNSVTASKQDGTAIDSTRDEKHDWSHARIFIKGDAYFNAWTGR